MDLAKYRTVFVEESTEHLAQMSRALLDLEMDPAGSEAIDTVFRMAHSIKGMAASLEYDRITELAHAMEDCMDAIRRAGRVEPDHFSLLFEGLDRLEAMIAVVRDEGAPAAADPALLEGLRRTLQAQASASPPKKKDLRPW